jgi:hypothetical protein
MTEDGTPDIKSAFQKIGIAFVMWALVFAIVATGNAESAAILLGAIGGVFLALRLIFAIFDGEIHI